MSNKARALILSGDGINCEQETAYAAKETGFLAKTIHVNDFLAEKGKSLDGASLLVIPGGFSFGDELGSGKILALKLKHGLGEVLTKFIERRGAVLGICNGFQVLTRLGVFGSGVVLAQNEQGHFINRWVRLEISGPSIFTDRLRDRGITTLELPVRHGEGRLVFADEKDALKAKQEGQIVLRYTEDVNGSWNQTAGLTTAQGRVMGLMPHPEAFWTDELHPGGRGEKVPLGIELFSNAYEQLKDAR
ncbi:MAG: phosphoribosylformylglycinamidine synthase subunit PurQ [Bdellovibrionota bacterium]